MASAKTPARWARAYTPRHLAVKKALVWLHRSFFWQTMRHPAVEQVILPLLLQLAIIILEARLFATIFRQLRQPGVVGEIFAGLALGPSLLGKISPELFQAIDLGVIPDGVFSMLVIMALLTTVMTTPLLLCFMRGTELEPHILQSGFVRKSATHLSPERK
jgi:hypothetical protein